MFQRGAAPAGLGMDAQAGRRAHEVRQRDVEHLHVHRTHVAAYPLLEDVHQEAAVLLRADRAAGHQRPCLRVQRPTLDVAAPTSLGDIDQLRRGPLDDGDELHVARTDLVAEEAVDLAAAVAVEFVDRAQDVELGPSIGEQLCRAHDLRVRTPPALVHTLRIVDVGRTVHRQADEEPVLSEECRPFLVEQRAVGLERVLDDLAGPPVALHQHHRLAEEVEPHERGFATLPGNGHVLGAM